jgi:hypothetical protein
MHYDQCVAAGLLSQTNTDFDMLFQTHADLVLTEHKIAVSTNMAMTEHTRTLAYHILLQNTSTLAKKIIIIISSSREAITPCRKMTASPAAGHGSNSCTL